MKELDERIERAVGSRPVRYEPRPGGYSTADRFAVDARRRSLACSSSPRTAANLAGWLRREHEVYARSRGSFIPELVGWDDDGVRPMLAIEDLSDADWTPRWDAGSRRSGARCARGAGRRGAAARHADGPRGVRRALRPLAASSRRTRSRSSRPACATRRGSSARLPEILAAADPRRSTATRSVTSTCAATTSASATAAQCSSTGTGRRLRTRPRRRGVAAEPARRGRAAAVGGAARTRRARRLHRRRLGRRRRAAAAGDRADRARAAARAARRRARLGRPRAVLAEAVGERLELVRVQADLARLDRGLDLAGELRAPPMSGPGRAPW